MNEVLAPIDQELLELLVCPVDHAKLEIHETHLVCTLCGRRFPIVDGIPNMVLDQM